MWVKGILGRRDFKRKLQGESLEGTFGLKIS